MSAELIAVLAVGATMVGVFVAVSGLMLSTLSDIRGELRDVHKDIGELREQMARLEGMFEGFTKSPASVPA